MTAYPSPVFANAIPYIVFKLVCERDPYIMSTLHLMYTYHRIRAHGKVTSCSKFFDNRILVQFINKWMWGIIAFLSDIIKAMAWLGIDAFNLTTLLIGIDTVAIFIALDTLISCKSGLAMYVESACFSYTYQQACIRSHKSAPSCHIVLQEAQLGLFRATRESCVCDQKLYKNSHVEWQVILGYDLLLLLYALQIMHHNTPKIKDELTIGGRHRKIRYPHQSIWGVQRRPFPRLIWPFCSCPRHGLQILGYNDHHTTRQSNAHRACCIEGMFHRRLARRSMHVQLHPRFWKRFACHMRILHHRATCHAHVKIINTL